MWGDVDLMMPAFQRDGYQSVTVKLTDPSAFESFEAAVERRSAARPQAVSASATTTRGSRRRPAR